MLSRALIAEAQKLLAADHLSQREIARRLGISRSTVSNIAADRLPAAWYRAPAVDDAPPEEWGRCPGCGGKVQLPCRLCHVREMAQRERDLRQFRRRVASWRLPALPQQAAGQVEARLPSGQA